MTYGHIAVSAQVDWFSTVETYIQTQRLLMPGYVEVTNSLAVAAWEMQSDGSFVLSDIQYFDVATSGPKGQDDGPVDDKRPGSFHGPSLSTTFVVVGGPIRPSFRYMLGVISQTVVTSTLTDSEGRPLPHMEGNEISVWGALNCSVSEIDVFTTRVDIP